ncbi:alpha/beta hydrolase family protein [Sphingobacterium hungaricum]
MIRFFTFLVIVFSTSSSFANSLVGAWEGDLIIPGGKLKFIIHIAQENSSWTAKADSPQQGVFNIPGKISVDADSAIHVEIQGGITYNGKLKDKATLVGEFQQSGYKTELVLSKSYKTVLKRTQKVNPPYAYDTANVKFRNEHDALSLSGTLTFPKEKGIYPAVILVSGSGPQDRNSTIFGHETFKVLADYLTKNKIVVLRYDDRGIGQSEGNFNKSTIADFSRDAVAALDYLKKQPQVDAKRIGIIGHSEGGLIAELLAGQKYPQLSFIVSLAGPSVSIDELMVEQLYKVGKVSGLSEEQLAANRVINAKNFSILKSNLSDAEAYEALKENMKNIPGYTAESSNELNQLLAPSFRYFMKIEPEIFIRKISIPVFAAFGSLDVQVDANQNIYGLQTILRKNSKNKIIEYPKLNHLFQTASTGSVNEYATIEETFNAQVMKDIANWIQQLKN